MNKYINNIRGVTLIELMATIAIMSIVMIAVFSVFSFGIKSFTTQVDSIEHQSNLRQTMSYITKEIRKADGVSSTVSNVLKITNGSIEDEYKLDGHNLKKNTDQLAKDIQSFEVEIDGDKIKITITSIQGENGQSESLSSEIIIR